MNTIKVNGLQCDVERGARPEICYILAFSPIDEGWMQQTAMRYGCSLAVISGMDWNNDLSPWQSGGVSPEAPPFMGDAGRFLYALRQSVIPAVESYIGLQVEPRRTVIGVSMSGLFALWAWLSDDLFDDIGSVSGSMWYDGFAAWVEAQPVEKKRGKVFLSLGKEEARSGGTFGSVYDNTVAIAEYLRSHGIAVDFVTGPGNHFAPIYPRLDAAMHSLFSAEPPRE
ncbi:MAG: hypothetical protein HDS68_01335 [Bacteroidales bacterium]|nr:hypothetical protein [Bacteroidales bacterium]